MKVKMLVKIVDDQGAEHVGWAEFESVAYAVIQYDAVQTITRDVNEAFGMIEGRPGMVRHLLLGSEPG
jgi:hypothetical protein